MPGSHNTSKMTQGPEKMYKSLAKILHPSEHYRRGLGKNIVLLFIHTTLEEMCQP